MTAHERKLLEADLKVAIKSGIETDYELDDNSNEIPVETFNLDWALKQVIEVLTKRGLL